MNQRFLGIMSGTSLDGIDAALVDFDTPNGMRITAAATTPFDPELAAALRAIVNDHKPCSLQELGNLDARCGEAYADAANALLQSSDTSAESVTAIGCHGQTVFHAPDDTHPFTMQIGDANRIVARTGITTVADFRRRDIAVGGQGAPLACGFHVGCFGSDAEDRVVLNLGGISNITVLSRNADVRGFDCGPANGLLDAWNRQHNEQAYDEAGAWASGGTVSKDLLQRLLADDYFSRPPPKSTGKEYFSLAWLTGHLLNLPTPPEPQDVQSTLAELTVESVAAAINDYAPTASMCIVCGGGAHNADLIRRLEKRLSPAVVTTSDRFSISPDFVEAAAFAWLAKQTIDGQPGNVPSVTGARHATVLGAIYPA